MVTREQLKEWRNKLGLSQPKAASALGVKTATYLNWEYGRAYNPLLPLAMIGVETMIAAGLRKKKAAA